MKAIETLNEHSESMTRGYGNVGHCGSWIEVNGIEMDYFDIEEYRYQTDPSNYDPYDCIKATSKTEWCRQYIESVRATIAKAKGE